MSGKAESSELPVIVKTYDLVVWTCKHVARFARGHRFTVGERLAYMVDQILQGLIRARYDRKERPALLRQINVELELLRFEFRLAHDLRCLAHESYGHASRLLLEIGQMVGGWLKSTG